MITLGGMTDQDLNMKVILGTEHPMLAETIDQAVEIPNKHGRYDFGAYQAPLTFLLECVFKNASTPAILQEHIRALTALLMDSNGRPATLELIWDYEPDKYYSVRYAGSLPIRRLASIGIFTLPLIAYDPFAYDVAENEFERVMTNISLTAEGSGNINSYPVITITALSGSQAQAVDMGGEDEANTVTDPTVVDPSITINGTTLSFTGTINPGSSLVFDSKKMTATLDGANALASVSGDFPMLQPGDNEVTFSSSNTTTGALVNITHKGRWV